MNISYNWLKDLIELKLSPNELAQKLTDVGLAVEGIRASGEDFIFDLDLTSNRGDCLSHLGIAREIGVIQNSQLKIQNDEVPNQKTENHNLVKIEAPDLCHRFTARIIRGVTVGASPEWLVKRLEAVGERSINNVADITNYVMHELGNPMHSFDLNKLTENRIVVRRARPGEVIKTLDEVERKLDETMLVICDAEKPAAIGGVMGGFHSGITPQTTDVLLEVACFNRDSIRQTSRKLKLSTEASHRFERGVDIANLIRASNRATKLICEIAGGKAGAFVDVYPTKFVQRKIESGNIQFAVKRLTGLEVETEEILRILEALGLKSQIVNQKSRIFTVPTWRYDVSIEEDLVEEVARIVGYDKIAEELPPSFGTGEYQPNERRKFQLRQTLSNLGFDEALSYSFIDSKHDETFALVPNFANENSADKFVTLQDSIIEGAVRMRPSLLSGLLDAVRLNFNHQNRNLRLYEIGRAFSASAQKGELPHERELFALVLTGGEMLQEKEMPVREFDFYDAKGALEAAIGATGAPTLTFRPAEVKHLRKGQSAEVLLNGKAVGSVGRLADEIAQTYKFRQPVFVAEVDLQTILAAPKERFSYRPLPVYPSIERDVSLLVKRHTSFSEIKQTIESQQFDFLCKVGFVDVYEGKGIADDERSLTIRLIYRSEERTLTETEIETIHQQILKVLQEKFQAKQRF